MLARRFLMFHFSDGPTGTVPQWVPMVSELLRRAAPGSDPALALLLGGLGPTQAGVCWPGGSGRPQPWSGQPGARATAGEL
eukprot:353080-Chlamydomonas_euryale.AAC.1